MQLNWMDALIGAVLTVGLVYAFYRIDTRYVWKGEKMSFLSHLTKTGMFPKRTTGYLSALGLMLAFLNGMRPGLAPGLTSDIVDLVFRIVVYPFLILVAVCVILVLKVIFFPSKNDPDRLFFERNKQLDR